MAAFDPPGAAKVLDETPRGDGPDGESCRELPEHAADRAAVPVIATTKNVLMNIAFHL